MRQRVSIEIWFNPEIKLEDIELSNLGVKLGQVGFEFDQNNKTTLLRNENIADTVHLNGTIDASITTEDFMNKLKGIEVIGVKFWDYKYPAYQPQSCCSGGFGFITTARDERFLGKQTLWLEGD